MNLRDLLQQFAPDKARGVYGNKAHDLILKNKFGFYSTIVLPLLNGVKRFKCVKKKVMASKERIQRLKDETRVNILEAAYKIVKEEGWQALSMRKIAEEI